MSFDERLEKAIYLQGKKVKDKYTGRVGTVTAYAVHHDNYVPIRVETEYNNPQDWDDVIRFEEVTE